MIDPLLLKRCSSVLQVNEENSVKEAHVEVQIESSSVAAVCGLRHAVLRRLQVHYSDDAQIHREECL